MAKKLILQKRFSTATGYLDVGEWLIPGEVSEKDAKCAVADGYGEIRPVGRKNEKSAIGWPTGDKEKD